MFTHSNSKQRKQKHTHSQLHKARSRSGQREREIEKMAGGMEANKNKFIEDWGSARETLEHNFRWTRRNLALVGIFGIAVPYLVYKGIVREFVCHFSLSLSLYYFLFKIDQIPSHFHLNGSFVEFQNWVFFDTYYRI